MGAMSLPRLKLNSNSNYSVQSFASDEFAPNTSRNSSPSASVSNMAINMPTLTLARNSFDNSPMQSPMVSPMVSPITPLMATTPLPSAQLPLSIPGAYDF